MAISRISLSLAAAALALAGGIAAAKNPMVGGAAMYDTKTIVENAANSKDHTTLVAGILTSHVVPGSLTAADIAAQANATGGKAVLTTVQGAKLTVWEKDGSWYVSDAKGGTAKIGPADVLQSNGVIHVIDGVLLPA